MEVVGRLPPIHMTKESCLVQAFDSLGTGRCHRRIGSRLPHCLSCLCHGWVDRSIGAHLLQPALTSYSCCSLLLPSYLPLFVLQLQKVSTHTQCHLELRLLPHKPCPSARHIPWPWAVLEAVIGCL